MDNNSFALITPEYLERVKAFREDWYRRYKAISDEPTPKVDGSGKKIIKKRPDNKDYIEDSYMSAKLTQHFPGWSWEMASPIQFLGSEWVCATGHLIIIDESLLAFNIIPPYRKYYAGDAVRIQYKSGQPHTPENIVDVGDNVQSAITGAKKRAINRLCGIGDDIYGKRSDIDGAGTEEEILATSDNLSLKAVMFSNQLRQHKIRISEVCEILKIGNIDEITDYNEAWNKIKEAKRIS